MHVTFTTGLMGAGKSKHLIEQYNADRSNKIAFVCRINEETGTKGTISSRNGNAIDAINLNRDQEDKIIALVKWYIFEEQIESIYIDEVQFLQKSTVEKIINLSQFGTNIYFFGLTTTFTDDYFEASEYLLNTLAEFDILYIKTNCEVADCHHEAKHNARIVNGKVARQGETFVEEKQTYMALCTKHYFGK